MSKVSTYLTYGKWPLVIIVTLFCWVFFSSNESKVSEKSAYITTGDGAFLNPVIWTDQESSTIPKTNCAISSEKELTVNHAIISDCRVSQLYGEGRLIISKNGSLTVNGDLEPFGNSLLEIGDGSLLLVHGDLTVSGNAQVRSTGRLQVIGNVVTKGEGEVCGKGDAQIGGKAIGFGMCLDLKTRFSSSINLKSRHLENNKYVLEWSANELKTKGNNVLSTSTNGMTFHELKRLSPTDKIPNSSIYKI